MLVVVYGRLHDCQSQKGTPKRFHGMVVERHPLQQQKTQQAESSCACVVYYHAGTKIPDNKKKIP